MLGDATDFQVRRLQVDRAHSTRPRLPVERSKHKGQGWRASDSLESISPYGVERSLFIRLSGDISATALSMVFTYLPTSRYLVPTYLVPTYVDHTEGFHRSFLSWFNPPSKVVAHRSVLAMARKDPNQRE